MKTNRLLKVAAILLLFLFSVSTVYSQMKSEIDLLFDDIEEGYMKRVTETLDKYPALLNYYDSIAKQTPLECAISNKSIDIAKYLIEKGADVTFSDNWSIYRSIKDYNELFFIMNLDSIDLTQTNLLDAAYYNMKSNPTNEQTQIFDYLMLRGVPFSDDLAFEALYRNDFEMIKLAMKQGIDLNEIKNHNSNYFIDVAAQQDTEILKFLLKNNITIRDYTLTKLIKEMEELPKERKIVEEHSYRARIYGTIEDIDKDLITFKANIEILNKSGAKNPVRTRKIISSVILVMMGAIAYFFSSKSNMNKIWLAIMIFSWVVTIGYSVFFVKAIGVVFIVIGFIFLFTVFMSGNDGNYNVNINYEALLIVVPFLVVGFLLYNNFKDIQGFFLNERYIKLSTPLIVGYVSSLVIAIAVSIKTIFFSENES